jgi:hypothetical protein
MKEDEEAGKKRTNGGLLTTDALAVGGGFEAPFDIAVVLWGRRTRSASLGTGEGRQKTNLVGDEVPLEVPLDDVFSLDGEDVFFGLVGHGV